MPVKEFMVTRGGVDMPYAPPRKRRQIEAADAKFLALWASDEDLPAADRKRAQDERDRRKQLSTDAMVVGVLEDVGAANPLQVDAVRTWLESHGAGIVLKTHTSRSLHTACRTANQVTVCVYGDDVILDVDAVLALPSTSKMPVRKDDEFWRLARKAKDKDIAVHLIWPDARVQSGRW